MFAAAPSRADWRAAWRGHGAASHPPTGGPADWPLIEIENEIIIFCSYTKLLGGAADQTYVDIVRETYRAAREVVAAISEANSVLATALSIGNYALYGLGDFVRDNARTGRPDADLAVVGVLPKSLLWAR